jgi:hypothetical protein
MAEAIESFRAAADSASRAVTPEHPLALESQAWLARAIARTGDAETARKSLGDRIEIARTSLGVGHPATLRLMLALAEIHRTEGKSDLEREVLAEATSIARDTLPARHPIRREIDSGARDAPTLPVP